MAINKVTLPPEGSSKSITTPLGFSTNQVSTANIYRAGVMTVVEFNMNNSTTQYLKFFSNSGNVEVGGTLEPGSGTTFFK